MHPDKTSHFHEDLTLTACTDQAALYEYGGQFNNLYWHSLYIIFKENLVVMGSGSSIYTKLLVAYNKHK